MALKILGLSGTNGSGKDTIAALLVERYGFYFASASEMLAEELNRRGVPTDREHKAALSAEWRRQYGMAAIVQRAYDDYQEHAQEYKGLVVGSLRHPGEVQLVHELGGSVVWVDADPRVRYERISTNAHARGRAAEDDKTLEQFLAEEEREMRPIGDNATLNMSAVKEKADIFIQNDFTELDPFKAEIINKLQSIL